jgi:hypothetical protein
MSPQNSAWLWQMIATAIAGGVISQLITGLFRWVTKPRLELQTGSAIPFVIVAPREGSPTGSATWIRVRVKNWGRRNAESCRVYLTDITKEGEPILKADPFPLWASAGGDGDYRAPLTISRKFSRFFDIGFLITDTELNVASDEFRIRRREPLPAGTYKLGIAASGTNFNPTTRTISIHFDHGSAPQVS